MSKCNLLSSNNCLVKLGYSRDSLESQIYFVMNDYSKINNKHEKVDSPIKRIGS